MTSNTKKKIIRSRIAYWENYKFSLEEILRTLDVDLELQSMFDELDKIDDHELISLKQKIRNAHDLCMSVLKMLRRL